MNKVRLLGIFLVIIGVLLMVYMENDFLGFMGGACLSSGSVFLFTGRLTVKKGA